MKCFKLLAMFLLSCFAGAQAELININPDPAGVPWVAGGYEYGAAEEAVYNSLPYVEITPEARTKTLDPMVDNSTGDAGVYFRPIFDQGRYGNCAHAASIGYAFTYEINRLRQRPANSLDLVENHYPVNYTYNYWNNGESGNGSTFERAEITGREYGIPNSEIWYQVTGDYLTGNAIQWMSGYEKYCASNQDEHPKRAAMQNRIKERVQFGDMTDPVNIENLKIYLANHGTGSLIGGVAVFGFDIGHATWDQIPSGYYMGNKTIFINSGSEFDHGMTIVGYDDNVAYDFEIEYPVPGQPGDLPLPPSNYYNNDPTRPKPMSEWEVGALKIANSWGEWPTTDDAGFIYLPYRLLAQGKVNEVCAIVPEYEPEVGLAYKINMYQEYRNELEHSVAMSINPDSELGDTDVFGKEFLTSWSRFGGHLPIQGVNHDFIEMGLDVTDLFNSFKSSTDIYYPKKFFFKVKDWVEEPPFTTNPNRISSFNLIDYRNNNELHIPCSETGVIIKDFDTTSLSIIYDLLPEFIDEDLVLTDNFGIPYDVSLYLKYDRNINVSDNTKFYLNNTSLRTQIPSGGSFGHGYINVEGNADFIGFSESSNDNISLSWTDLNIGQKLNFKNCNLVNNSATTINLAQNSQLNFIGNSFMDVLSGLVVNYGLTSSINFEDGGHLILRDYASIAVDNNSELYIKDNLSGIQFGSNSQLVINSGSTLRLAGAVVIPAGSQIVLEPDANLIIEDNVTIAGDLQIQSGSNISISDNSSLNLGGYYDYTINSSSIVNLGINSRLSLTGGAYLFIDEKVDINAQTGSEIVVSTDSFLSTLLEPDYGDVTIDNYIDFTGTWNGIICEPYSMIELNRTRLSGAVTAINGTPLTCVIEQCEFTNCETGINIFSDAGLPDAMQDLQIKNCKFTGSEIGTGISLTQTDGQIVGNTINNFNRGMNVISCSPIIMKNTVQYNKHSGVYIAGYNAAPQLNNPLEKLSVVNNIIKDNGEVPDHPVPTVIGPSQISVVHHGYAYLDNGLNNIYTSNIVGIPDIPCVRAASLEQVGEIPKIQTIYARNNYWGFGNVTDDYFLMGYGYNIVYDTEIGSPLGSTPLTTNLTEPESKSFDLLMKALESELDGKYDKAIKEYEKIIDKYPDSEEAIVAYAKLPDSYEELNLDLSPLLNLYDTQLASADENTDKKFFKEMKVTANLKSKKYDDAISISEDLILEAETEEEVILCEIDIAIANMMKDAENGSKGKSLSSTLNISDLISKLTGSNSKSEPANISENTLPSEVVLYQNYPNPFNPVTQIRFALAKTADVKLNVYNVNGQKLVELTNSVMNAGVHAVDFDGSRFNSGVYYYTLEVEGKSLTQKMILMK